MRLSQTPSLGTLRPSKEESKDWDNTQNLYIEGDNLEVLKLLQKSYHSKVKMIYIDPPYNTGNDFVYPDDFRDSLENYKKVTGQVDSEGNRISTNTEASGRYHTDWLNMMYPRLRLARNLLTDDGVIFISIDDNEIDNLKKICGEVFGVDNFLTCITRATGTPTGGGFDGFVNEIDYILVYAKLRESVTIRGLSFTEDDAKIYNLEDKDGKYLTRPLRRTGGEDRREDRPTMYFPIIAPDGTEVFPLGPTGYESRWICGKSKYDELVENNLIEWKQIEKDGVKVWQVYQKFYLENRTKQPGNLWINVEGNKKATRAIRDIFDSNKVFDFPKPVGIIENLLELASFGNDLILDFFSGSATTAHAVMKLNVKDGGNRKFIMVQLPESTDEKSEAYKAGYMNICEIGKERIRRAGEKIKEEKVLEAQNLDIGFKVLKLDTSNIRKWQPDYDNLEQSILDYVDNYVDGRTALDVVYEIMIKYGLDLDYPVDEFTIAQKKVYSIGFGMLMICLDNEITTEVAKGILEKVKELAPESTRVVFKDNGFKTDSNKTNIKEILKSGGIEEFITL
ncbi:site-specific DNA-methyltransferase [Tissierella pigra]|uniref:site-specific DNA-methyltransferase n=1 Tax=Tissierella pigra TaxID=2607614 RepID=UPI001E522806|nr:site-specific DNA-methyltransferase [Tissierella pigra]